MNKDIAAVQNLIGVSVVHLCANCDHAYFHWDGERGVCFYGYDGEGESRCGIATPMFWYNDNNNCDYFKARVITEGTVFCGGNYRKRVKIWECWGNVVDRTTGMIIHENVVWTVADDRFLIRKPTPNPFWPERTHL